MIDARLRDAVLSLGLDLATLPLLVAPPLAIGDGGKYNALVKGYSEAVRELALQSAPNADGFDVVRWKCSIHVDRGMLANFRARFEVVCSADLCCNFD